MYTWGVRKRELDQLQKKLIETSRYSTIVDPQMLEVVLGLIQIVKDMNLEYKGTNRIVE